MHTRRANYSPTAERESYDREGSPKRRRIEETSAPPDPASSGVESHTEESGEEDIDELNIDRSTKTAKNQTNPQKTADLGLSEEEEDELLQRLLDQAERNSRSHSKARKVARVTLDPGHHPKNSVEIVTNNKGLTVVEDSDVATQVSVKRLSPPISKRQKEKIKESTAGEKWFDMPATEITPKLKQDLMLLQMRDVLDPKRHYRASAKSLPKYFQMGTIIESPTEFFSARIKKKDRKETIVEELLEDQKTREYFKRKYNEIQEKSTSGGKKWYRQQQERKKKR